MAGINAPRSSRCVFVGNIPYDATEQQLIEIFQEVGPVVSFRLVFDRDTGKPKGYGFCEYRDSESAMSAMRNLNGYDFNGRTIRVDVAENETKVLGGDRGGPGIGPPPGGPGGPPPPQQQQRPPGDGPSAPFPNMSNAASTPESITTMLEGMSTAQMYEIVAKMKAIIQQNAAEARQILLSNPPLAYALLQAQAMLGMINMQTVQKLLLAMQQQQAQIPPAGVLPPQPQLPPQPPMMAQPPPMMQPAFPGGPPPGFPGGVPPPQQQPPRPMGFPPGAPPPFAGMPPMGPGIAASFGMPNMPGGTDAASLEQQALLLQQIVNLTPEMIQTLPPEQREQVQQLRQQLLSLNPNIAAQQQQQQQQAPPSSGPGRPLGPPAGGPPPPPGGPPFRGGY